MNLKLKLNFSQILASSGKTLLRLRGFIIVVAVVGMIGYAGYLVSQLVALTPDQAYLTQQRQDLEKSKIKFDKTIIVTINGLNQVNPKVDLSNVGKADPFSP